MPRSRNKCYVCGRPSDEAGPISKRGKCSDCAERRMIENQLAMRGKNEQAYAQWVERWREGCGNAGRPITPYDPFS